MYLYHNCVRLRMQDSGRGAQKNQQRKERCRQQGATQGVGI